MGYEVINKAFKRFRSGREVCLPNAAGRREYQERRKFMYYRDNKKCCLCGEEILCLEEATFEHTGGRGMGGAKRDDRVKFNGVAHFRCNQLKGSMSMQQFKQCAPKFSELHWGTTSRQSAT